jgi:hypothetical protein
MAKRKRRRANKRPFNSDKIQIRLGDLGDPLTLKLLESGEKVARYIRRVIAADLGVECPEMKGQVKNLVQYRKASSEDAATELPAVGQ